jgi:hypothetical protein
VTAAIDGAVEPLLDSARERFDAEQLCEEARLVTGLDDFGKSDFREPLEVACRSAETEADLHIVGRARFRDMVLRLLTGRLRILEYVRRDPGVLDERIDAPVVVTGSPRSGSSILHQLLALHPDLRAPLSWEYFCPTPPPDPARTDDPRIPIADRDLRMSGRLAPAFQGMHEMSATMTRECVAAQAFSLRSDDLWANFFLPSYQEYLIATDMTPAYDWHRLVLQILQRKTPGTRWVLKAPSHLATLPELFAAYPDAELVVTHRDALEVLSSVCSLLATLQWAHSTAIDFSRVVELQVERNVELLERLVRWRADHPDARAHDVRYADYVSDPLGTLVQVSDALGAPLTGAARSAMSSYLDAHPQGRDGGHRHDVAALGIDPDVLRQRFARYEQRFLQSGSTGSAGSTRTTESTGNAGSTA